MKDNLERVCVEAYTPFMSFLRTDTPLYKCGVTKTYCLNPEDYTNCVHHKDYEANKLINNK